MFDPSKPVQTRDGRPAILLTTTFPPDVKEVAGSRLDNQNVAAVVAGKLEFFYEDGTYWSSSRDDADDLINVPDQTFEFLNVYPEDEMVFSYPTEAAAKAAGGAGRLLVKLTRTDGKVTAAELA